MLEESQYRKNIAGVFEKIVKAFDSVDPDTAEAEYSQGSVTILASGKKIIVSPQPPVHQIWLAAAALGIAAHFSWDLDSKQWLNDKDRTQELFAVLSKLLKQTANLDLKF